MCCILYAEVFQIFDNLRKNFVGIMSTSKFDVIDSPPQYANTKNDLTDSVLVKVFGRNINISVIPNCNAVVNIYGIEYGRVLQRRKRRCGKQRFEVKPFFLSVIKSYPKDIIA